MEFLSNVSPKLGYIITGAVVLLIVYVALNTWRRNTIDAGTKKDGIDVEAEVVSVIYDDLQRVNNHLAAVVSVKYKLRGNDIVSKRGIVFPFIEKDKFEPRNKINIRVSSNNPDVYYYLNYENL